MPSARLLARIPQRSAFPRLLRRDGQNVELLLGGLKCEAEGIGVAGFHFSSRDVGAWRQVRGQLVLSLNSPWQLK
jgi:hypothetical protein